MKIKNKINNNEALKHANYSFAKRKADYSNNLINMCSTANQPAIQVGGGVNPINRAKFNSSLSLAPLAQEGIMNELNQIASPEDNTAGVQSSINKNILPFFSTPIILKKISDQKNNKNLNQLNPQKKLVYKIIKLNTKLVEFTTNIKKYNFNLNSFKGNNLDFILFIKNNLYYNLKYRLSNILYKIEKFVPVFKLYSLLNNINLFSPKRLLKPQSYIRFSYRMKYITKISKNTSPFPAYVGDTHKIMEINGRAINYLLVRLNNLVNEIEYIINIKNKFIK
jgi:hypothetical protein